jgi:hypothetical protein
VQPVYNADRDYSLMSVEELEQTYSLKGTQKEHAYLTRS